MSTQVIYKYIEHLDGTLTTSTLPFSSCQALPVSRFRRIDALQIKIIEVRTDRRLFERTYLPLGVVWVDAVVGEDAVVSWRY